MLFETETDNFQELGWHYHCGEYVVRYKFLTSFLTYTLCITSQISLGGSYHLVLKNNQTPLLTITLTADYNKRIYLIMEIVIVSTSFSEKPFKSTYDSVTDNGGFKPHLARNIGSVCSWYPKRLILQNMREASSLNSQNSNPITPKI